MCQSMVDIQPAAAEIRRGKKRKKKKKIEGKKLQGKNMMAPYYIGRPQLSKQSKAATRPIG